MNKIESNFKYYYKEKKKAFIPYVMVGDGGILESESLLDIYVQAGARIIEIGVPFSDSTADGKTIQEASKRALNGNTSLSDVIDFIKKASSRYDHVAFVLMTYLNPIVSYGIASFFSTLKSVGASGVIIPDLPIEEYDLIYTETRKNQIDIIPLITLGAEKTRIKEILSKSSGFVYAVTLKGVTGTKEANVDHAALLYNSIRGVTDLPIISGFGINTASQIAQLTEHFDGVVVASQLIKYAQEKKYKEISSLISCL